MSGSLSKRLPDEQRKFRANLAAFLEIFELPGCCGVEVIKSFAMAPSAWVKTYPEEIKHRLEELDARKLKAGSSQPAMRLITLNENEMPYLASIITDLGFEEISAGVNKKTDRKVYLFRKILHPIPKGDSVVES